MKNCPFCRKEINSDSTICPLCKMVLIEKIDTFKKQDTGHEYKKEIPKYKTWKYEAKKSNFFKKINLNNKNNNVYAWSFLVILIFSSILSNYSGRKPSTPLPPPGIGTSKYEQPPLNVVSPENAVIPPNGTVLNKQSQLFKGKGVLLIKNGSGSDALVKLVPTSIGKSVYTVYIHTGDEYTIKHISDGTYKLLFSFGDDWDNGKKMFVNNQSSEMFDDDFDYTTTSYEDGDYIRSEYGQYTITLNPVIGGTAKTSSINQNTFNQY